MITRRSMIKAGLAAAATVPVAIVATAPDHASQGEIVIGESLWSDNTRLEEFLAWFKSNVGDPIQWGMPVTIQPDARTLTGPYYPGALESSYHYERTVSFRTPLPASLA